MTKRDVVALAGKILGLLMVVYVLSAIPQTISTVAFISAPDSAIGPAPSVWLGIAASLVLYGVIAWFLLMRAETIGSWLYPEEEPQATVVQLDKEFLLQVAFIALGVFFLAQALMQVPGTIVSIKWHAQYPGSQGLADAWAGLVQVVLQFGIGACLAAGPRGLMRALDYLRYAGAPKRTGGS